MTSTADDPLAKVRARRALRAPRSATEKSAYEDLRRGEYAGTDALLFASQSRMGWAKHAVTHGVFVKGMVRKAALAANDEVKSWAALGFACSEAVFDGYALACELSGRGGDGSGAAFTSDASASRFETRAVQAGPRLDTWPHAAITRALIDELGAGLDEDGVIAVRNALAAGLLLHAHEHPGAHADLDALAKPEKKAQRVVPVVAKAKSNAAMLDAILAAPGDDKPRLVYADWLQEHGDPRGEFIVLQCRLGRELHGARGEYASATGKRPAEVRELKARELQLLERHGKRWLEDIRPFIRQWTWRRGFPRHVSGDAAKLVEGLPQLSRAPLESMQLTGYKPSLLATFFAAKPHPTVERLDLSQSRLHGEGFAVLGAPFFSRVSTLDLWGNDLRDVTALARCALPSLQRLRLTLGRLNDAGLAALAEAPFFPRLTHLAIDSNDGVVSLRPLAAAKGLRWLAAPFTRETVLELIGQRRKRLALHYTPHEDDVTGTLRAHFGEPAEYWGQLDE